MSTLNDLLARPIISVTSAMSFCEEKQRTEEEKKLLLASEKCPIVYELRLPVDALATKSLDLMGELPFPTLENANLYLWQFQQRIQEHESTPLYPSIVNSLNAIQTNT